MPKTQYEAIEGASQFHENFRELLRTDPNLKHLRCYQEVNVEKLIPNYQYKNHHFDWFIETWGCIVELHGAQHYKIANYGNISAEDAEVNLRNIKFRDSVKEIAARSHGYIYVAIPYKYANKLTYELLEQLIQEQND